MYQQVLTEAPWIEAVVRGEGEEIFINLVNTLRDGRWLAGRADIKGMFPRRLKQSSRPRRRQQSRTWSS
jgi:hypothetical protein